MESIYSSERTGSSAQGAQWIFGSSKFTDEEHARIQEALNTALSWEQINSRQGCGGKRVHYLAGHTVVENANKIFGFNGWDSSILHLSVDYVEKTSDGKWTAAATAIVRVSLKNGVGHEDVGNAHLKDKDKGEVLEKTKKAAVTDAIKRALRLFGEHLGGNMSNKEGLKSVERTHKQNQRALKARQENESSGRLANALPPPRLPQQHPPQHHQQPAQPTHECKVETSFEDKVAGRWTPPVRAVHESHQNSPGPPRPDHTSRHPPPQLRHQPETPRQQQQHQRMYKQQPQGGGDPRNSINAPGKPRSPGSGGVLNSSPRAQSPLNTGDHRASNSIPSDPMRGALSESCPNRRVPTTTDRQVSLGKGICDGGGPAGSVPGGGGRDETSFLHKNCPVFDYSLDSAGSTANSVPPQESTARPSGSSSTGSGSASGPALCGSKGIEDDFGLSQDYASVFLEVDSAIQRHTSLISAGSTDSGSEVTCNGNDVSTRQQSSPGSTGIHNGGRRVSTEEAYSERAITPQGQLAGNKRFRA